MGKLRIAFASIAGLALIFPIFGAQAGNPVPVFIWGLAATSQGLINPFDYTSQKDFSEQLSNIVGGSPKPVLVLLRDDLCAENLNQQTDTLSKLGDGSWYYWPGVETPVEVLENLPLYNVSRDDEQVESVSEGQLIITKVADLDGILNTFNIMKASSPQLVAILTGNTCRYSHSERIKRAADDPTPAPAVPAFIVNTTRILLVGGTKPTLNFAGKNISAELTNNPSQSGDGTKASPLKLTFEYTVKNGSETFKPNVILEFPIKTAGYYTPEVFYLRAAGGNRTGLRTTVDPSFPFNFSYHCSQNLRFGNMSFIRFDLIDFQMEVDGKTFGQAYDCVGFMTIPIWAGIFVTSILAIIMVWGLTMIMDIRTMDRFDDPKGKTITVSAAE